MTDAGYGRGTGALEPGRVFGGYRIDAIAGQGGMGVVCRATHLALDRTVALKVITPALAADPEFRARFGRECRLAASLDHPNVIPIIDAGEVEGQPYVSMRWIEGADLRSILAEEGPMEATRALALVAQVGSALDAAHEAGLVHRDVKPANILVEQRGGREHAYLADFGLVKRMDSDTGLTGTGWIGTVDYVAPEQIRGEEAGPAADLYSLGAVLYTALTGRVPYPRGDIAAQLYATVNDPVPGLSASGVTAPAALDEVLARAMAKDPADRQPTGEGLSDEVATALAPPPPPAWPPPSVDPSAETWGQGAHPVPAASWGQPAGSEPADPASAPTRAAGATDPLPARRRLGRRVALSGATAVVVLALVVIGLVATSGGSSPYSGPSTLKTFTLAGSSTPVSVQVPDQPVTTVNTVITGITFQVYLVKRVTSQAALVVAGITIPASVLSGNYDPSSDLRTDLSEAPYGQSTVSGLYLFDPTGMKLYEVFTSDVNNDGDCVCSTTQASFDSAHTYQFAAYVAAPPSSVKDVSVDSGLELTGPVPISS